MLTAPGQHGCECASQYGMHLKEIKYKHDTSGYAMWFKAGGAICIAHYDVIDNVITQKL